MLYIDERNKKIFLSKQKYCETFIKKINDKYDVRLTVINFDVQKLPEELLRRELIESRIQITGQNTIFKVTEEFEDVYQENYLRTSYHTERDKIIFNPLKWDSIKIEKYKIVRFPDEPKA